MECPCLTKDPKRLLLRIHFASWSSVPTEAPVELSVLGREARCTNSKLIHRARKLNLCDRTYLWEPPTEVSFLYFFWKDSFSQMFLWFSGYLLCLKRSLIMKATLPSLEVERSCIRKFLPFHAHLTILTETFNSIASRSCFYIFLFLKTQKLLLCIFFDLFSPPLWLKKKMLHCLICWFFKSEFFRLSCFGNFPFYLYKCFTSYGFIT